MTVEYTAADAHAAAARGAEWLDERCPDWPERIDSKALDLQSSEQCMLGQTAECLLDSPRPHYRYGQVLRHFDKGDAWAIERGFDVPIHKYGSECNLRGCNAEIRARYEMLTIAWREYIRERLAVPE